jgi:uncharacterized damage-inducible protein DinB
MAGRIETLAFKAAAGRSAAAMTWLAHLDDQTKLLAKDLEDITPAELQWQPKRGMNTIGMLLAHLAIVEVFWLHVTEGHATEANMRKSLGVGTDDDGMPLPPAGTPPRGLSGLPFKYYLNLIQRGRRQTRRILKGYRDVDLARSITRTRRNGQRQRVSLSWILYHLAEHFSGHYGQILLIRHLYRDRNGKA